MLAGSEAVARDREMRLLGRGADIDHRDRRVLDDVLIIERGGRRLGERFDLGQTIGADLADMQLVDQRRARERLGADTAAPAGADDRDFNLFHLGSLMVMEGIGGAIKTMIGPRRKGGCGVTPPCSRKRGPGPWPGWSA